MVRSSTRFSGETGCSWPFGSPCSICLPPGPLLFTQSMPERRVELRPEARGEEAVAEQAARGVQDEHVELRLGDREAMRPRRLGEPADDGVDVLDVVDHRCRSAWPRQSLIGEPSAIALRVGDELRRVAAVLAVDLAQRHRPVPAALARRRSRRQARVDEIVEAGELAQAVLPAELVEARHAALAVADEVERRDVDLLRRGRRRSSSRFCRNCGMVAAASSSAEPLAAHAQRPVRQAARRASRRSPCRGRCR